MQGLILLNIKLFLTFLQKHGRFHRISPVNEEEIADAILLFWRPCAHEMTFAKRAICCSRQDDREAK